MEKKQEFNLDELDVIRNVVFTELTKELTISEDKRNMYNIDKLTKISVKIRDLQNDLIIIKHNKKIKGFD
jgi:hypothetical protein